MFAHIQTQHDSGGHIGSVERKDQLGDYLRLVDQHTSAAGHTLQLPALCRSDWDSACAALHGHVTVPLAADFVVVCAPLAENSPRLEPVFVAQDSATPQSASWLSGGGHQKLKHMH